MRTINIYKFDELTDDSKMTAISNLRGEFETWYRENELRDIFQTKKKFENIFNINVLVEKEEESNSYDWIDYKNYTHFDGENDGLVSVSSAKWGNFLGVLTAKNRGISHGDIIDLTRQNIEGFDVCEFYVNLVNGLKEKGM